MKADLQPQIYSRPEILPSNRAMQILQRNCACGSSVVAGGECTECRKKGPGLQRKATGLRREMAPAPPIVHEVLRSLGRPLDSDTRAFLEPRFGQDFSQVKVHTGTRAAESARSIQAQAYTVGRNIVFNTGQYAPDTPNGQRLLAHELVHTVQQGRSNMVPDQLLIDHPSGFTEQEADLVSRSALAGRKENITGFTDAHVGRQPRQGTAQVPTPLHVAGRVPPDQSYKIIRLAWTLDDGPTNFTQQMRSALGARSGTWFIMRNLLGTGQALQSRLANYVQRQRNSREEIAIHSMHPSQGHVAWFPVKVSSGVPQAYNTINAATQHLRDFTAILRGAGLSVHFVRLPGGLLSELVAYLGAQGIPAANRRSLATRIIRGEDVATNSPAAAPVQRDFNILQSTLTSLNLQLWGGGSGTQVSGPQSWEAESSGTGLTDDVTQRFTRLVDQFPSVHRPRSLIVLAHDTSRANAAEVGRDVAAMESYALNKGVQVEYYTLSDLFRIVRGQAP